MTKYVVDTNIILEDPNYIFTLLEDHEVIIHKKVIDELDSKKHLDGILGYNARLFAKLLRDSIHKNLHYVNDAFDGSTDDTLIQYTNNNVKHDKILLTNDNYMLAKAKLQNIKTFSPKLKELNHSYTGVTKVELDDEQIQEFCSGKPLVLSAHQEEGLNPNQILIFTKEGAESAVGFALYCGYDRPVKRLPNKYEMSDITAKNKEQVWLMQLGELLAKKDKDNSIDLLTIEGQAGTGKTLLALCIAINMMNNHGYKTITLTKPVAHVGNQEVGFLKGSYKEKIMPLMQSYIDILDKLGYANMEMLFEDAPTTKNKKEVVSPFKFDVLTHMRGRNIGDIIILDEAQGLSKHEMLTLLTRADEGAKVILIADTKQIDAPYLSKTNNGFTHAVENLKHLSFTAHIKLEKSERSRLAEAAGDFL